MRVAMVSMPFQGAARPSIQVGLLSAIAEEAGFRTDTFHFALDLAAEIGPEAYESLATHRGRMTGEWLFSVAAFGERVDLDDRPYMDRFADEIEVVAGGAGVDAAYLSHLRHELLPAFVEARAGEVDWGAYGVVGFTSSFQQNVASIALARRIKERHPHVRILFGGANFEDEMGLEYVRAVECIDFAVIGEGDVAFPALLRRLDAGEDPAGLPGVALRRADGGVVHTPQAEPFTELDRLPVPEYGEYFERARSTGLADAAGYPGLVPFESSRGCWWGAKHHCTFCGLNGLGMKYRSKRPQRVLDELSELARRHRLTSFEAVDNILDLGYLAELFGPIERDRLDFTMFYEVKANLSREQVRMLQRGGVREIQPGIESLSTHVLQLMSKGCTMLQNVRLLKWAHYYRVKVGWNLLRGFPGELAEDYERQLAVLRQLSHLQPPGGSGRIWLERFSPHFSRPDLYPARDVAPEPSYGYAYPAGVDLDRIAYFFEYSMDDTLPEDVHAESDAWLEEWRAIWDGPQPHGLTYRRAPDRLFIDDDRGADRRGTYTFEEPLATLYEACGDTALTVARATAAVHAAGADESIGEADVRWALDQFCERGLMLTEEGRYLSLALPSNPNW
jgi:ribosomal peptide maturation radical SAM protein 1